MNNVPTGDLAYNPLDERQVRRVILESHPEYRQKMMFFMLREIVRHIWHRLTRKLSNMHFAG